MIVKLEDNATVVSEPQSSFRRGFEARRRWCMGCDLVLSVVLLHGLLLQIRFDEPNRTSSKTDV